MVGRPGWIPPLAEFVSWTAASFHTQEDRDRFIRVIAIERMSDVEAKAMPGVASGALVRWRPGRFLSLNDVAYAHGGRIAVTRRYRDKWIADD